MTVVAMEDLRFSLKNPPEDWAGDPCLPRGNSWTGVSCSEGDAIRVISLYVFFCYTRSFKTSSKS